ncbi:hypothetical protein Q8F55_002501 [Vanrija albida]|uniref:Alpha-1,2-mannosidase n=1 Tax=Vanrija albida TaxID=181172 RepID=A0ABR3Q9Z2_9TREE
MSGKTKSSAPSRKAPAPAPALRRPGPNPLAIALNVVLAAVSVFLVTRHADAWVGTLGTVRAALEERMAIFGMESFGSTALGHIDFADGRSRRAPKEFLKPASDALTYVNVNLGNGGPEPDLSGGMIPAVAPPFAMTRWTAQTRRNYVSMCPYNQTDTKVHGFIGTHQPAVWMGESGPVQIATGLGEVVTDFDARGLAFDKRDEYASPNYYSVGLKGADGSINAELSATSRAGHLKFTFKPKGAAAPFVVIDAARKTVFTRQLSADGYPRPNLEYLPTGGVTVDLERNEIYGWNDERQDKVLVAEELPAKNFKGYFVARFSAPLVSGGISRKGKLESALSGDGTELSAWATFGAGTASVDVRVGVSFISVEQARRNLDLEIPSSQTLAETSKKTRTEWVDKLDTYRVQGGTDQNYTVLYTGFAHTLVYPYEVSENAGTADEPKWTYYSGYADAVLEGESYSGYSIWDTFRATTAWQNLLAPERIPGMISSMLQDYKQGGWLPMWKNIVETNIMVGTHADSIIAQAMRAGVKGFDYDLAWEAVRKDAFTPPDKDTELVFYDRQEGTPQEVRAGLTEYLKNGWVAADLHSESGSRSLDYAYDDHAAAIVARTVGDTKTAEQLEARAKNYAHLWNKETGFMEARNYDGSWAGDKTGWTEGDHWAYSLNVMHDVPGLIELMGGDAKFIDFMDRHFAGGHNLHTNEPSHHIPYLYAFSSQPHKAQEWVTSLGGSEYNHTAGGLSGNEDCGQMSAWYVFSALGFYPVDPASGKYVIGSPFFDRQSVSLPGARRPLSVVAVGAATEGKKYIKSLKIDGEAWWSVEITHDQIKDGAFFEYEMADTPQAWPRRE